MIAKLFEVRDRATFLPVIATSMTSPANEAEFYLLRRAGYGVQPLILLTRLDADGRPANYDPYAWGDRTMRVAHQHIQDHWLTLESGDVVDVEYILGERDAPKVSERGR
jgi:hypothetical protein